MRDYNVKIILDSVGPARVRLTTWELTYPRMVHSELMTHRVFSRNSASSRAITVKKMLAMIKENPVMPKWWGKSQSGMQAREELTGDALLQCKTAWVKASNDMTATASYLDSCGLHKQITNRIVEPWMFITVIVTATSFSNWFKLRNHPDAQPEIQWVAKEMHSQYKASTPQELEEGKWHLPYLLDADKEELDIDGQIKVSVGRCARVSYLNHDGIRDLQDDINLHDKLTTSGHWSAFEHVCKAASKEVWNRYCQNAYDACIERGECFNPMLLGNIVGWLQYRKLFEQEHGFDFKWEEM